MAARQLFSTLFYILHPSQPSLLAPPLCQITSRVTRLTWLLFFLSNSNLLKCSADGVWIGWGSLTFSYLWLYRPVIWHSKMDFFIQWPAIKPQIKTFRTSKPFFFSTFPNNEPPFLLPVHWWWDRMWKMWQMVGWPTWKYYFLLTHHLLLASMGAPIWSALTKLAPLQNLSFDLSSKGSEKENADIFRHASVSSTYPCP